MQQKTKPKKILFLILALIILASGLAFYFMWQKMTGGFFKKDLPAPISSNPTIEDESVNCLAKIPIEGDPLIGASRREDLANGEISNFFYSAYLESVEEARIENCDMAKITVGTEKNNANFTYTFYLPTNITSTLDDKIIYPLQMSKLVGERIEIMVGYRNDLADKKKPAGILGWKFEKVLYTDEKQLSNIQDFYKSIGENK